MKVVLQYEENEKETAAIDWEKLYLELNDVLRSHFAKVSYSNRDGEDIYYCNTE